jgi:hypothetical protein
VSTARPHTGQAAGRTAEKLGDGAKLYIITGNERHSASQYK